MLLLMTLIANLAALQVHEAYFVYQIFHILLTPTNLPSNMHMLYYGHSSNFVYH